LMHACAACVHVYACSPLLLADGNIHIFRLTHDGMIVHMTCTLLPLLLCLLCLRRPHALAMLPLVRLGSLPNFQHRMCGPVSYACSLHTRERIDRMLTAWRLVMR
jgi:hypothetical protein